MNEPGRTTFVGAFPIGIDFDEFAQGASMAEVANRAAEIAQGFSGCRIVLGVDRLDYTKGIPQRLAAFRHLLEGHPELRRKISLIQVVVPSREDIPKYGELKAEVRADGERDQWSVWGTGLDAHSLHSPFSRST